MIHNILITTHKGDMRIVQCQSFMLMADISAAIEAAYGPKVMFNGFVTEMQGRQPHLVIGAAK